MKGYSIIWYILEESMQLQLYHCENPANPPFQPFLGLFSAIFVHFWAPARCIKCLKIENIHSLTSLCIIIELSMSTLQKQHKINFSAHFEGFAAIFVFFGHPLGT